MNLPPFCDDIWLRGVNGVTEAGRTAEWVAAHGKAVYGFCLRLTGSRADADDLYQETFLKAHRLGGQIRDDLNPGSFLLSLATGIYQNESRKRRRRQRLAPQTSLDDENLSPRDEPRDELTPELAAEQRELRQTVAALMAELDDTLRIPMLLRYMRDLPLSEIAAICNLPEGTVKSRLHKARGILKTRLEAMGYAP